MSPSKSSIIQGVLVAGLLMAGCDATPPSKPVVPAPSPAPPPTSLSTPILRPEPKSIPKSDVGKAVEKKPIFRQPTINPDEPLHNRVAVVSLKERVVVESPPATILTGKPTPRGSSVFTVEAAAKPAAGSVPAPAMGVFNFPVGLKPLPQFGAAENGLPLRILSERDGMVMALVPSGIAKVGTTDGPAECRPEFTAFVDAFYMDTLEVTVGQFLIFKEDSRAKKRTMPGQILNENDAPNLPAVGVNWPMALAYARWLGKELPTEVEFERATRGDGGFRAPWGDSRAVWQKPRTPKTLVAVGSFPNDKSPFGIYDLAGNAREWCADWYAEKANEIASRNSSQALRNWSGPKQSSKPNQRVQKGNGPDWAAWHRQGHEMSERSNEVGFRCVWRVPVAKNQQ